MVLQRNPLDFFKVFKIFRSVHQRRMSGLLRLWRGSVSKIVWFRAGFPIAASSTLPEEALLTVLMREGLLSAEERMDLLQNCKSESEQARRTVERGLIALPRLQKIQMRVERQRMLEALSWMDGEFLFEPQELRSDIKREAIDVTSLLLEAVARFLKDSDCSQFVDAFRAQALAWDPMVSPLAEFYESLFPSPNARLFEQRPVTLPELTSQLGRRADREACALLVSGIGHFVQQNQAYTAPQPSVSKAPSAAPSRPQNPSMPPAMRPSAEPQQRPAPRSTAPAALKKPPTPEILARIEKAKSIVEAQESKNYYELLEVEPTAEQNQIRDAFRKFAREFHADRFARFEIDQASRDLVQKAFIVLNRAHETLSSAELRKEYDLSLKGGGAASAASGNAVTGFDAILDAEKAVSSALRLTRNNQMAAALELFQKALTVTPEDPLAQAGAAYCEFMIACEQGRSAEVVRRVKETLTQITKTFKRREEPLIYLGRVQRVEGDLEAAAETFKKAVQVAPHNTEAALELRLITKKLEESSKGPKSKGLFGFMKKG